MTSYTREWKFAHEGLVVYQRTLQFSTFVEELAHRWPAGRSTLRRQLLDASDSILLNIAEGSSQRAGGNTGVNFMRIALGSAGECSAILDRLKIAGIKNVTGGQEILREIGAMLTRFAR